MRFFDPALRAAALVVSDRRWAAPLTATALGFGLFAGVALGPRAAGSLATAPQVIEVALPPEEAPAPPTRSAARARDGGASGSGTGAPAPATAPPAAVPPAPLPSVPASEPAPTPASKPSPPAREPRPETLRGTVAHVNPAAGSYTVAARGAVLFAIHARDLPNPGEKVEVSIRDLVNGTYAEDGPRRRSGAAERVKLSGTVSFVSAHPRGYVLSNPGVSVLVRVAEETPVAELPPAGSFIDVTARIETEEVEDPGASGESGAPGATGVPDLAGPPDLPAIPGEGIVPAPAEPPAVAPAPSCPGDPEATSEVEAHGHLWQEDLRAEGDPFGYSDFAGIVTAVCTGTSQLRISADDVAETEADLLFTVPQEIEIGELLVGDSVAATGTIGESGELELSGLAGEEGARAADDPTQLQGDLSGG